MSNYDDILNKIRELIPDAPDDWIQRISKVLGVAESTIYSYANGTRGRRNGGTKKVLIELKKLVEDETKNTKQLIA